MQPSKYIINNLTINVYDDKSSASFIKKQKNRLNKSQNKIVRRERSVEMYDEDVYAEDALPELEKIDWDTLVRNTAEFHCVFAPQKPAETFDEYTENKYTEVEEDEDEAAMNAHIENAPYHQEMLDAYIAVVAKVCEDMKKDRANKKKEYTCCTGCFHSNGRRPFHFCKRSYAANYASDEDDDYEDEV
jgi:hypothetical protein